jgi:ribonuclease HI
MPLVILQSKIFMRLQKKGKGALWLEDGGSHYGPGTCPLKLNIFIWLVVENKILTWENLQRRGFIGPSICILCKQSKESVFHLFVECPFRVHCLGKNLFIQNCLGMWNKNTFSECFKNWILMRSSLPTLPVFICWYIWSDRNHAIFEDRIPSAQKVAYQSLLAEGEYTKPVKALALRRRTALRMANGTVGWFDGEAMSSGLNSGVGGVIRTHDNHTFKWTINCGPGTNTRVELLGAWELLTLASRLSISEITVQGDSKIIIEWLRGKGRLQVISLECWKDRLEELKKNSSTFLSCMCIERTTQKQIVFQNKRFIRLLGKLFYFQCVEEHEGPPMSLDLF